MTTMTLRLTSSIPIKLMATHLIAMIPLLMTSLGQSRGERARAAHQALPELEYSPETIVYVDALWYRVHAADSPALILRQHKHTMTLKKADSLGYRIGESGQSGRELSSFRGYRRKHPTREIPDDALLVGNMNPKRGVFYPGCHRNGQLDASYIRKTKAEWIKEEFHICAHCIERGPSFATISEEDWNKLPQPNPFFPPDGWQHRPFPTDRLPSKEELEVLIQELLSNGSGIQEFPYFDDPVASLEHFSMMRFFFPVNQWLHLYQVYRATGDQRIFDLMLESARHYHQLAKDYPSVAQLKASDPEGLPFMYTMAICSRIILQKARQAPETVTHRELNEASNFLRTMVAVLHPNWGKDEDLDATMQIPQKIADDFRSRAYNRAMNGIGTLAVIAATLEDLQAINGNQALQSTIDRYRKTVSEYVKNWFNHSHFSEFDGKKHFYYPYKQGVHKVVNGEPIFKRPEDAGHYSHTLQGLLLIYESMPEVGIDDDFMTAVANAVQHNATTKITREGKRVLSGHLESPIMSSERPYGSNRGGHQYSPARARFYLLQAFREDMIDSLGNPLNKEQKAKKNSDFSRRVATLYVQYLKAFRHNRNLIHLTTH